MTPYQNQGVLLIRVFGFMTMSWGTMGFFDYAVLRMESTDAETFARLVSAFSSVAGGCVVLALSKRIGAFLGQGLGEPEIEYDTELGD